jgi:hypothetical protein
MLALVASIFVFGVGLLIGRIFCGDPFIYNGKTNERKIITFAHQIVSSVVNKDSFYGTHASDRAIKNIEKYADNYSAMFRIYHSNKDPFGDYEFITMFENGKTFYGVIVNKRTGPYLDYWDVDDWSGKLWTPYSRSPTFGE